jgi:hypothetical protein
MQPSDLTIEILKGIRDEVRGINSRLDVTNSRLDETNERLDVTNSRLDETNERLEALRDDTNIRFERFERRQAETELRLATELVAVAGAVREVRDQLREDRQLRVQVEDHERRLAALENRPA